MSMFSDYLLKRKRDTAVSRRSREHGEKLRARQKARDDAQARRADETISISEADAAYTLDQRGARSSKLLSLPKMHLSLPAFKAPRLHLLVTSLPRSRFIRAAILMVAAPLAVGVAAFAMPNTVEDGAASAFRVIPESPVIAQIDANAECASQVSYQDRFGNIISHHPRRINCSSPYITIPVHPDTAIRHAPPMAAVEGRFEGPGRILTLDLEGLARAVRYGLKVGGTSPEQTALEFAIGFFERDILRKLAITFFHAPSYAAHRMPTMAERIKFAIDHMGCARGVGGTGPTIQPVAGHLCAALVGKTTLDQLTLPERCLIEGSRRGLIRVPGPRATQKVVEATFVADLSTAKRRAATLCLPRLLDGAELQSAQDALDAIEPPDLDWLRDFMRGGSDALPGASSLHADMLPEGGISPLEPAAQRALQSELRNHIPRLPLRGRNGLCLPGATGCRDANMIDIALAVIPVTGASKPIAVYQSRASLLTDVSDPLRSHASLVKALLVPLFVENGLTTLCRRPVNGLQDAGGYLGTACAPDQPGLSLERATAISSNLAFFYGLEQISDRALKAYLDGLGFRGHEGLSGYDLRRSLLMGDKVTISADALLASFLTLVAETPSPGPFGTDSRARTPVPLEAFFGADVISRSQASLRASAENRVYGTARHAAQEARISGCSLAQSKTGTADGSRGIARDRFLITVLTCDGKSALLYGLVGSHDPRRDLGASLTAKEVGSLVVKAGAAALRAVPDTTPPIRSPRPIPRPYEKAGAITRAELAPRAPRMSPPPIARAERASSASSPRDN